ncbi:MAG: hypothetical protein V4689_22980 [Verrucomicrobiota bacterium]
MGSTYRFLSVPADAEIVCEWFRFLDPSPVVKATEKGELYDFNHLGALADTPAESPIVNVIFPRMRRGVLTTAGEVHFLATPAKRFPELDRINQAFRKWVSRYPKVHSAKGGDDNSHDYLIEGTLRNWDSDIFALPSGIKALKAGHYFVADDDSEGRLDDLCKQLRLRGVGGLEEAETNH